MTSLFFLAKVQLPYAALTTADPKLAFLLAWTVIGLMVFGWLVWDEDLGYIGFNNETLWLLIAMVLTVVLWPAPLCYALWGRGK